MRDEIHERNDEPWIVWFQAGMILTFVLRYKMIYRLKDSKKLFETFSWKDNFLWIHEISWIKMCKFSGLEHKKSETLFLFIGNKILWYHFIEENNS